MAKKVTKKKTPTKKKTTARKPRATKKAKAPVTASATPEITEDAIRARAFEIYTSGRNPGNADADWLDAERELRGAATN